jgi:hypothetical protein
MLVMVNQVNLLAIDVVKVVTAIGIMEEVVQDGLMAI